MDAMQMATKQRDREARTPRGEGKLTSSCHVHVEPKFILRNVGVVHDHDVRVVA